MNKASEIQETSKSIPEPKLLGSRRPLAGALLGIPLYALLVLLAFLAKLDLIALAILLPGVLASYPLNNNFISTMILFVISALPLALCGFLIFSKQDLQRIIGVWALFIYFLLLVTVGTPAAAIISDF